MSITMLGECACAAIKYSTKKDTGNIDLLNRMNR
jgi:hypothetical protein